MKESAVAAVYDRRTQLWSKVSVTSALTERRYRQAFIQKIELGLSLPDKASRLEIYSSPHEQGSK